MKTKRFLAFLFVLSILFVSAVTPIYADDIEDEPAPDDPVDPYEYVYTFNSNFIIEDGIAEVGIFLKGFSGITTRYEIDIKLQHRFLFWWSDVTNGTWHDTIYGTNGDAFHNLSLSQYGDFRAIINVKVYGTGTDYDEIDRTLTASR